MAKKTNKKAAKKAPAKKTVSKAAPKKVVAKPQGSSTGNGEARSAARGGSVPQERYAKDPKSVALRLKEKADRAFTQAANAIARAEAAGVDNGYVKKLAASMDHFEAAKKALA
jgi:hypothetical protein